MTKSLSGGGKEVPPLKRDVCIYFNSAGIEPVLAFEFYDYYSQKQWKYRGNKIGNWKVLAWQWIWYRSIPKNSIQ
jgi:hypothetical protein